MELSQNTSLSMIIKIIDMDDKLYVNMEDPIQDRLPTGRKPKHDNYKVYDMSDVMELTEKIIKGAVQLYEMSKNMRSLQTSEGVEVMVYADYVYLINKKKVSKQEMYD